MHLFSKMHINIIYIKCLNMIIFTAKGLSLKSSKLRTVGIHIKPKNFTYAVVPLPNFFESADFFGADFPKIGQCEHKNR